MLYEELAKKIILCEDGILRWLYRYLTLVVSLKGSKSYLDSAAYTDILLPELRHRNGEDVGFSLCHHHSLSHGSGVEDLGKNKTVPVALFPQLLKKTRSVIGPKGALVASLHV